MRKIFFWLHLIAGSIAGAVILIMSVTGVLLTYEKQMLAGGAPRVQADAGIVPLTMEALVEKHRQRHKALPSAIVKRADAGGTVEFQMGREGSVYLNPYNGEDAGPGPAGMRRFFRTMTDWHRWLGQNGEGRETARAITGACNLAFLFLALSGMYLWLPRQFTWKHFRAVLFFRGGLAAKAREFNWHNVFGIWMALPLVAVIATGAVMSYPWANDMLYKLSGSETPSPGAASGGAVKKKGGPRAAKSKGGPSTGLAAPPDDLVLTGFDRVWAQVEETNAGWRSISARLPASNEAPWQIIVDKGSGGQPHLRTTLTYSRSNGNLLRRESLADLDTGRQARTWVRWIHTGEAGGLAGQTLAGVASLAGALLVYTGIALGLRRYAAWRARSQSEVMLAKG